MLVSTCHASYSSNVGLRTTIASTCLLLLVAGLVGCTDSAAVVASQIPSSEPSSEAPQEGALQLGTPPANPGALPAGCEGLGASGLAAVPNNVDDRVSGYVVADVRDAGATKHASGEAILDDAGMPVAYKVAEGDTSFAISERFCIGYVDYLGWINSVRRNGVDELFPGDILNLNRFTITSVGDENGVVYENEPTVHIPEQE